MPPYNATEYPGLVLGHLDTANSSAIHCTNNETYDACVRREHTHDAVANAPLILLYFLAVGGLFFARKMIARSMRRTGVRRQEGVIDSVRKLLGYERVKVKEVVLTPMRQVVLGRHKSVGGLPYGAPAIARRTRSASQ